MEEPDYNFYATTEGCIVISDYYNRVMCHFCNGSINPLAIDPNGKDLFITYYQGSICDLIQLAPDYIDNIIFERNDNGNIKSYNYKRFKRLVDLKIQQNTEK